MEKYKKAIEACTQNEEVWTQAYINNEILEGYEVSNFGNIRSYWRTKFEGNKIVGCSKDTKPRLLKSAKRNNYSSVSVKIKEKKTTILIHRMVLDSWDPIHYSSKAPSGFPINEWLLLSFEAKLWIGSLLEVDHKNTNKSDNNFCNLERVTGKENSRRALKEYGGNHRNAKKIKKEIKFAIRKKDGAVYVEKNLTKFCRSHNINRRSMQRLVQGEIKSCEGFVRAEEYYINNNFQIKN